MTPAKLEALTRVRAALDVLDGINRATLLPSECVLFDGAHMELTLLEADLGGKPRDPELVQHAVNIGAGRIPGE